MSGQKEADMSWEKEAEELGSKRALAQEQGGAENVARQHAKGLLTIRERIDAMLDGGSFQELGGASGDATRDDEGRLTDFKPANFVLGFGMIDGRRCVIGGEDFTLGGGSPNAAGLRKSVYTEELACTYRVPLVRLHQGAGGSVAGAGGVPPGRPKTVVRRSTQCPDSSPWPRRWPPCPSPRRRSAQLRVSLPRAWWPHTFR